MQRSVVEMVLERGEDRHDVVVKGLKEIALSGKVIEAECQCARWNENVLIQLEWVLMLSAIHKCNR